MDEIRLFTFLPRQHRTRPDGWNQTVYVFATPAQDQARWMKSDCLRFCHASTGPGQMDEIRLFTFLPRQHRTRPDGWNQTVYVFATPAQDQARWMKSDCLRFCHASTGPGQMDEIRLFTFLPRQHRTRPDGWNQTVYVFATPAQDQARWMKSDCLRFCHASTGPGQMDEIRLFTFLPRQHRTRPDGWNQTVYVFATPAQDQARWMKSDCLRFCHASTGPGQMDEIRLFTFLPRQHWTRPDGWNQTVYVFATPAQDQARWMKSDCLRFCQASTGPGQMDEIRLFTFLPCQQRTRPDGRKLGIAVTCNFTKWVNKHIVSFQIWDCVRATLLSDRNPECAVRRQQCQTAELIPQVNAQLNWHREWMLSQQKCNEKAMKLSSWVSEPLV